MVTLAVTGHMDLTVASAPLVRAALREVLAPYRGDLAGVSCIAAGADSLFAQEVIALGGRLVVVIPSRDYRQKKVNPDHAPVFDLLVREAAEVVVMPHGTDGQRRAVETGGSAGRGMERRPPPSGKGGGTADAVIEARESGLPVDVVWPSGAARQAG